MVLKVIKNGILQKGNENELMKTTVSSRVFLPGNDRSVYGELMPEVANSFQDTRNRGQLVESCCFRISIGSVFIIPSSFREFGAHCRTFLPKYMLCVLRCCIMASTSHVWHFIQ